MPPARHLAAARSRGAHLAAALILGLVAAVAAGPAAAADPARLRPGDSRVDLRHGGLERSYLVHLPPPAAHQRPLPVLLAFHGGGGNGAQLRRSSGLDAVADRERFVVVYPDGTGRGPLLTWNAGTCCGSAVERRVDDVGFVLALLDDLGRRVAIDRGRVYATGMSNGGMMAHRLAAEAPDRIAAIAPVAGGLVYQRFAPARPVPVLHIHSLDDPNALYHGGLGPSWGGYQVLHPDVDETMARWAAADGCTSGPHEVERRVERRSGHTATLLRWEGCARSSQVGLWRLTGAGHVWPGQDIRRPRKQGEGTRVIDANQAIWDFVSHFRIAVD